MAGNILTLALWILGASFSEQKAREWGASSLAALRHGVNQKGRWQNDIRPVENKPPYRIHNSLASLHSFISPVGGGMNMLCNSHAVLGVERMPLSLLGVKQVERSER